ncbi:MAG: energy transducer TonB [Paludibacteraceae bacterium]|nr:energy transducer TonB [Paludibacteraceae bacterium]
MQKFFAENLRYPIPCVQAKIEGRVVCSFVVDKTGEITDIEVVTPVHPLLDAEAVRVIKLMPKWIPGRIGDKPVRVRYSQPIRFKL